MRAPRPTANIMRAIGLDSTVATRSSSGGMEIARCGCGSRLEFGTGSYGQSTEQCTNRRCPNAAPHRPGDFVELSPLRQASPRASPAAERVMRINVVHNGGEVWECDRHPNTHLSTIALMVMKGARIEGRRRALMDWEMRDVKGDDLAFHLSIKELGLRDGQTLYLSPRPGSGA